MSRRLDTLFSGLIFLFKQNGKWRGIFEKFVSRPKVNYFLVGEEKIISTPISDSFPSLDDRFLIPAIRDEFRLHTKRTDFRIKENK